MLNLLVEGSSIRAAERITGHHRDTIMRLLVLVGGRCQRFLAEPVRDVPVQDVQADEIWGFVEMKERTKAGRGIVDEQIGDAYTSGRPWGCTSPTTTSCGSTGRCG